MRRLRWPGQRRRTSDTIVGIAQREDEIAVVALTGDAGVERARVVAWDVFPAGDAMAFERGLRRFVDDHHLHGATSRITLPASGYDLKLVERPANVPDPELADATRWLIRDLVEIDVETAAIAVVTVPDQRGRARTPHMFVVAARDETVASMARVLAQAGLVCGGFEVVETAMLALESSLREAVPAGAMVRVDAKSSTLTLASEGRLYLARPLRIDAATLDDAGERALARHDERDEGLEAALEPLVLDVQRSLDYYESEYGRPPATRLTLLPGSIDLTPLAPFLATALRPLRVEAYALEHVLEFDASPPSRAQAPLALAVGAALAGDLALGESLVPHRIRMQRSAFGLGRVTQAAAVVALVLGLLGGFEAWRLHEDRGALEALAGEERALADRLARAMAEEGSAGTDGAHDDPATLRAERDARLALLRDLGQQGTGDGATFSSLLTGLARQHRAGVWLERIELLEGGAALALSGRALRAEDVPALLRRLRAEPAFRGRAFGTLEIERPTDASAGLRFHVATRNDGAGDEP
ncbi:MAG: PilN domain-containing protein [Myxococcota bacterium]